MTAYDLIGMQTQNDVANLIGGLVALCGARREGNRVKAGQREAVVQAFPIGIDVEGFRKLSVASVRAAT